MGKNYVKETDLDNFMKIFATLANKERMKILLLLEKQHEKGENPLSFQEIKKAINISENLLSYHLNKLKKAGLIKNKLERKGRKISHYEITEKGTKIIESLKKIS